MNPKTYTSSVPLTNSSIEISNALATFNKVRNVGFVPPDSMRNIFPFSKSHRWASSIWLIPFCNRMALILFPNLTKLFLSKKSKEVMLWKTLGNHLWIPKYLLATFESMFRIMPLTLLFLLLMLVQSSHAQEWQRAVNWNFGDKAALNFGTQPPISLGGSGMGAVEGCASISDTLGNLLFYSNGAAVWNKNHQIMENGNGLLGHVSSTQAALIVPQPGNDSLYYVFTTDALGVSDGFRYSIVNKNLAGGLGAVTTKNVLLQTSVCEKLAATKHANGRDVWILTHGFGNDIFYAYFLGERGITNCPIESRIGSYHGNGSPYAQGAMVFSNSGKRLAVCQYELNRIELFDFNASNGCLSNFKSAANQILPYSACFSPDEKVLYSSTRLNYIYQYSLQSQNSDSITASRQSLYNPPDSRHSYYCYIQQGLDNKLYLAMVDL